MFKIFALFFICIGIYIGINYSHEIETMVDTEVFETIKEKTETFLLEKLEEIKDKS